MPDIKIIAANLEHMVDITRIYNHAVLHGTATFETEALSLEAMTARWQDKLLDGFPFLVAIQNGTVIGFANSGHFRARKAFCFTVEDSIYLAPDALRQGAGRALLMALIKECRAKGFKQMLAVIGDSDNHGSIGLHTACGFEHAGILKNTGYKFERFLDTVLMQLDLSA